MKFSWDYNAPDGEYRNEALAEKLYEAASRPGVFLAFGPLELPPLTRRARFALWRNSLRERLALRIAPWLTPEEW